MTTAYENQNNASEKKISNGAHDKFWCAFKEKNFSDAMHLFDELDEKEKQSVLAELFQKSESHRRPVMVSVLRRELHEGQSFDDFYQSWFPSTEMCQSIKVGGQLYQQHFPTPVRVINAINAANPKEIFSVAFSWVANKEEEKALWNYVAKASIGKDQNNETRREKIKDTAAGELLGICRVESDDNLGAPF